MKTLCNRTGPQTIALVSSGGLSSGGSGRRLSSGSLSGGGRHHQLDEMDPWRARIPKYTRRANGHVHWERVRSETTGTFLFEAIKGAPPKGSARGDGKADPHPPSNIKPADGQGPWRYKASRRPVSTAIKGQPTAMVHGNIKPADGQCPRQ